MNNLNYFNTGDKSLCSGCSACQQACPFDALSMQPDEEGFIFPVKNLNKCTECGLCERICPFTKPSYPKSKNIAYGCYVNEEEERKKSSSGALFAVIAKSIIMRGGIVYGAYLSKDLKVFHKGVDCIEDLNDLRSSKYVQSDIQNTYREIKELLKHGKEVYFCGTGCQVAGLKAFLRKNYDTLITSDLVCHGVPPQKLFDDHIEYLNKKFDYKITGYSFRNNNQWGVNEYVKTSDGVVHEKKSFILSPYLNSFISGITFRYSCYNCPYAHLPRQGDITLADLWGASKLAPKLNTSYGVSLGIINSDVGNKTWDRIKKLLTYYEIDLDKAAQWNHNIKHPSQMPEIRKTVFKEIQQKGYEAVAHTIFRPSKKMVLTMYTKKYLKKLLGKRLINIIR